MSKEELSNLLLILSSFCWWHCISVILDTKSQSLDPFSSFVAPLVNCSPWGFSCGFVTLLLFALLGVVLNFHLIYKEMNFFPLDHCGLESRPHLFLYSLNIILSIHCMKGLPAFLRQLAASLHVLVPGTLGQERLGKSLEMWKSFLLMVQKGPLLKSSVFSSLASVIPLGTHTSLGSRFWRRRRNVRSEVMMNQSQKMKRKARRTTSRRGRGRVELSQVRGAGERGGGCYFFTSGSSGAYLCCLEIVLYRSSSKGRPMPGVSFQL